MHVRWLIVVVFLLLSAITKAERTEGDSTKNGMYLVYDDSSRLILKGYYKDTLRVKTWTEYDDQGLVSRKIRYRKGKVQYINLYKQGVWIASVNRKGVLKKKKDCGC